ncbi:MAG TPA: hypothetical protein PKI03_05675, partial [Pseudomonadota bacterium]|nr:hypothetical protein [Pseudomonadota bacterium]
MPTTKTRFRRAVPVAVQPKRPIRFLRFARILSRMYAARCNKILAPASPSLFLPYLRYTLFMLPLVSAQQMRSLDAHTIERL